MLPILLIYVIIPNMGKFIDLTNKTFNHWTVLEKGSYSSDGHIKWKCQCSCGFIKEVLGRDLRCGRSTCCTKCSQRATTHGYSHSITYQIWRCMINRCTNENKPAYHRYGGRGITVGDRWRNNFLNFLEDMGERPPDKSIDRINNSKGYFKENCRWTTPKIQARNTRSHIDIGEERNGWKIIDRVTENNIYKAKAKCVKCNRIIIRETHNLTHRSCYCPSLR